MPAGWPRLVYDAIGFTFDKPSRVDERGNLHECASGLHVAEELAVRAGRLPPSGNIDEHDLGSNDLLHRSAGFPNGLTDDFKAADRLAVDAAGRRRTPVGSNRRRPGNGDVTSDPDGPAEADLRLEMRP